MRVKREMTISRYVALISWTVFFILLVAKGFGLQIVDAYWLMGVSLIIAGMASAMDNRA